MKAGIVLGIHGSIEGILEKAGGNAEKVSEMLLIRKYSDRFDDVFVFSHDSRSYESIMPDNCRHIKFRNRFLYMLFGWFVMMFFTLRHGIFLLRVAGPSALPVVFISGILTRRRIVLKYYYLWFNTFQGGLQRFFMKGVERFLLLAVDYIIPCNREVEDFVPKKRRVPGVNEGIITSQFDPERVDGDKTAERIGGVKLIFVGRLVDVKDPLTLVMSYREAKKVVKGLNLMVCGDGDLMERCKKGADSDVHFLGFVGNIPSLLKSSDIYVITSKYDASPRSLMESMCMGLPTIATRVGGIPEYLTEDCGLLFEPGDVKGIARGIEKLSKNEKMRTAMGRKARERILKYYDLEKNLSKEISFISKLK